MSGRDLTLEEFKARIPLAEVVGRYVRLTRRGREHVGLCPFHKEKTPSFNVVESKGFYHCFGCGAHGTAIDFVMAVEGLSFPDALARIADLTGIPAPRRTGPERSEPSQRLYAANAAAAAWFRDQLADNAGREALAYLLRRGLEHETIRAFGLGYAPGERTALKRALVGEGFSEAELVAAGLLVRTEDGETFDRFRHRVMFPIADERGRIVGFGGRALGEARAKYLNTSETELFHKGELLYNLHRAAKPARERREIVLAEGYMDVIALSQAGLDHAVAPLGTAVTERQLQILWRLAEAPIVCLDGDRAGLAAALRTAERALPLMRNGQSLRFVILPDGEDPDSYLRRHGAEALAAVLSKAHTLSQMIWRLETQGRRFDTPEARAALSRRLRGFARAAGDPDLRASLWDQFRTLLDELTPRSVRGQKPQKPGTGKLRPGAWEGVGAARLAAGISRQETSREARLILPLLRHPEWLVGCEEELAEIHLEDPRLEKLRQEIVLWFADAPNLDADTLQRHLLQYGFGPILDQFAADLTQPSPPATETDEATRRRSWRDMLAAIRHKAALRRERATEDDLRLEDGERLNRWFYRLDRLLNRYGADDAESDDGSPDSAN
ncbi:DNA primase [Benzoatithermus flavus]|uniref:DNA primase n=1 Tax=Benzoatithermus flavus TaxID=3108223 RepID=A0ABU8XVP7_9PROT